MADEEGIFKRCGCTEIVRDDEGNPVLNAKGKPKRRELGSNCPLLEKRNHGTWWYQIDVAPLPGSKKKRRRIRRGGFATSGEAKTAISKLRGMGDTASQRRVPNDQVTVSEFLDAYIKTRRSLKRSTLVGYQIHIDKYLKPYLGEKRLLSLSIIDTRKAFDDIEKENEKIRAKRAEQKPLTRGQKVPEGYETRKPLGAAGMQRLRATARKAWNSELAAELGVTTNPFKALELPSGEPPKPQLWTVERVKRWEKTRKVPGKVMVWTPEQLGQFLDFCYVEEPRLAPLYELIGNTGMRRGEACGLREIDVDDATTRMQLEEQLTLVVWDVQAEDLKSERSKRTVPLSPPMKALLVERKALRDAERKKWGTAWEESGRVFTQPGGAALHPDTVSDRFRQLVKASGLPPITLHGLRHCAATTALAAGVDMKVVQELLGHASLATTEKFYTSVVEELQVDAVTRITNAIPRKRPNKVSGGESNADGTEMEPNAA